MLQRLLKEKFRITGEKEFRWGGHEVCLGNSKFFMLVPAAGQEKEYLQELEQIALHFKNVGDNRAFQFLKTEAGESVVKWEGSQYCVLVKEMNAERTMQKPGRKLAKFHHRGRLVSFELKKVKQIGQWRSFWETRLTQMEQVWNEKLLLEPENEFERMFLESFPYYMGLAENGIQYLTDTELDDQPLPNDSGTVCHHRFTEASWGGRYDYKNPFDWVFDHCARDLAEWTRERYFHNIKTYEPETTRFFRDYQSFSPLSSFSWRLLYARLLFPLHYFDCIEEYYTTSSEQQRHIAQDRLMRYLQCTNEHEDFLRSFYDLLGVPVRKLRIPQLDWLQY